MFASPSVVVAARVGRPPILFQGNVPSVLGFHEHSHRDECAIVTSPVHPSLLSSRLSCYGPNG